MMEAREKKANRPSTTRLVGQMLDAYYEGVRRAPQEGKLVAWVTGPPAFLPLLAMDIAYLHGEGYAASISARKLETELKEAAEVEGYSPECCSYSRISLGCALFAQRGIPAHMPRPDIVMPRPNFIMTVNSGCTTETNWFDCLCRHFKVPGFLIDIPYVWDDADLERHIADVASQFRDLVAFLEDLTGRPYDWDRLREVVGTLKKAATLRAEGMQRCKNIPSPASFFDWAVSLGPVNFLAGWPGTVEYFEKLGAELEERVAQGIGAVLQERYRLFWDGILFWPKVGALAEKFAALDACVIAGRYTHLGFYSEPERIDPDRPLESIADFVVRGNTINRNPAGQAKAVAQLCREYSIDGIVVHALRTCRPFDIGQQYIADQVSQELGIPAVTFEGDHGDVNYYSETQVDTRIRALIEALAPGKRRDAPGSGTPHIL